MNLPSLNHLSQQELVDALIDLRKEESVALADIVLHLSEVDSRGIYRDLGYPSLYAYCTIALGYSESAAYRRITAARCLSKHPEVYEKIRDGRMSLCAVAELSKVVTTENKAALFEAAERKSRREVEKLTAPLKAPEAPKRERVVAKAVTVKADSGTLFEKSPPPERVQKSFSVQFDADEEFMELYKQVRSLMGGVGTMQEVLRRVMKEYQKANCPIQRMQRRAARAEAKTQERRTRHIPAAVRDEVFVRDNCQCTFSAPDGRRCCEKRGLEIDHIVPFAVGGSHEAENLRLLCPAHNRLMAERVFGKEKIAACISRG
jgi:5-methylcytosine-specific restriction endonuclease McrA